MYDVHCKTSGGYITDEVKMGITLHLLGSGSAHDLAVVFDISKNNCMAFL